MDWISVKDKLPQLDEEVLVYVNGVSHNSGNYETVSLSYLTQYYGENFEAEGIEWSCKMSCLETVTHWIPLPPPPKNHVDKTSTNYFMTKMTQDEFDILKTFRPTSSVRMGFETGFSSEERYILNTINSKRIQCHQIPKEKNDEKK